MTCLTSKPSTHASYTKCLNPCSHEVRLNCSDGTLLAHVVGSLPTELRSSLQRSVRNAFLARSTDKSALRHRDTEKDGETDLFPAVHFGFYARSGTSVS